MYCAGGLLDALVIVQYMHVLYKIFYGKWCARDRSLCKEARSSGMMQGWWQANQSLKTISINRRTGGNIDWGVVLAQSVRVSAFTGSRIGYRLKPAPVLVLA